VPTATLISADFAPLAQVTGVGAGCASLPVVTVPHPVGHPDLSIVEQRGIAAVLECVRVLTTPATALEAEFDKKKFPLSSSLMQR
jgi:hypothetical protein